MRAWHTLPQPRGTEKRAQGVFFLLVLLCKVGAVLPLSVAGFPGVILWGLRIICPALPALEHTLKES